MRLVSRSRALHIKNIQMPPPPPRERRGEREGVEGRIEGEHRDSRQNLRAARRDSANYVHETM